MQVVNKYFVILDHMSNKFDLCCDITSWTVYANDSIQGFALYTGTLPIFKCRYATRYLEDTLSSLEESNAIDMSRIRKECEHALASSNVYKNEIEKF